MKIIVGVAFGVRLQKVLTHQLHEFFPSHMKTMTKRMLYGTNLIWYKNEFCAKSVR